MASADRLVEIFNEAKARAVGAERDHFLSEACQGQPELKEQVLGLLQAHEGAGDFLKNTQAIPSVLTEKPGDKIGRYKLLQKIGEGGCGVVYMAEQEEPMRRRVAFKVIKLGMDTKQVVARFEAEGQALALMDHPNIAKVFDAGATHTGRPYFVMELVRGIKITEYCDQHNLPTEARLKLFAQVCHAIQHAHQKGIIHRDIKPSNILVTVNDGVPVPKVIDFGIAKAIEQRLTAKTVFTAFEQFIGTPAYMSPEQAEMTSVDIDTRADIYSLGVLLYELLSGNTPFDAEKLVASGVAEIRRIIREQEPPKPSTRLNALSDADLSTVASRRQTDPPKLMHRIRGDLDWIVMKCLEKDRTRRYETASGLAMDLERHLSNEPVVARPTSTAYRTLKFIRRYRVGVAMAAVVTLVLMVGLAVSLAGFAQARRERDRAQTAQVETLKQKLRADQGAAESHRRLVLQYLADGNRSVDAGDLLSALPWFGRALEEDQADPLRAEMHRLRLATIIQQSPKLVALCFHSKTVNFAEFSRDGSRFVTAGTEGTARVWNAVTGEAITPWLQHTGAVPMARFSPDGLWVATACQDGTAQIWNATTGEPRVPPLRHTKGVRSVAFSPDGLWLLTAGDDTTVQVWEAATGQRRGPPLQHRGLVRTAEFSPDGTRILSGETGAFCVWIWSPDGAATLSFRSGGTAPEFSPDGQRVGLIYAGSSLRTFDTLTGKQIVSAKVGAETRRVMFSPDGTKIVTVGETSQIWDAATGAPLTAPLRPSMLALAGSFSPNGRWVMTAGTDKAVRLWDPATGDSVAAPLTHAAPVRTATFSPDGRRILTGCDDGTVRLWDLAGGESASLPVKHERPVYKIAFHPDSQRVLTVGLDGTAVYWELATGRRIESILTNLDSVSAADFSADGQRVALGYHNGTVQVWNLISGAPVGLPFQHQGLPIQNLEFSPGGLQLVTAGGDGFACVWDLPSGNLVARLKHTGPLSYATFAADGKKVVTATDNSCEGLVEYISDRVRTPYRGSTTRPPQVQVWDAATGAALGPSFEIEGSVSRVAFSPDRRYLVTACSDPTATAHLSQVFVWDLALGKHISAPLSHLGTVVDACFSSDSKRVVTSGGEGTVRIWDAATGKRLATPLSSAGAGRASFSPDNHLVITAGFARGARLWDATTGEPVSTPVKPSGAMAVNLAMFSPDGKYAVLATGDGYVRAWKIPRSNRSLDDDLHYAQMLAGGRVDEQEAVALFSRAEIKTIWEELRAKYPGDFMIAPEQVLAWRQKYAADNTYRAQEHIRLGQLAEARVLISKIRLADSLPEVAAVLDDLVNLRETIDHGSDAGKQRQIATESLRIPVDNLTKGKAPSPVTRQAEYLRTQGKSLEAEKLFEDVIALERKTSGDASVSVGLALRTYGYFLVVRENKPGAAERPYREELAVWEKLKRVGSVDYTTAVRALIDVLESQNKPAETEALYHEVLTAQRAALGNSPVVAETLISLADFLQSHEKPVEAEQAFREGMDIALKLYDRNLPRLRTLVRKLAQPIHSQLQSRHTGRLYDESIQATRQKLGETNQVLGDLLSDYALLLEGQNKFAAAAECHLKSLPIRRANPNDNLAATLRQLGGCLVQTGEPREAEVYLREALALYRKLHQGEDLHGTAWTTERLANALWLQHRLPEAEQAYRDALLACSKCQAMDSWVYAGAVRMLLDVLEAEKKPAESEALCREVLAAQRAAPTNNSPIVPETLIRLAGTLQSEGKTVEAEQTLREGIDLIFKLPDPELISLQWGIPRLAETLHAQGKSLEAVKLYDKLVALERKTPGDSNAALAATLHRYGDLLFYFEKKPGAAVELYLKALRIVRDSPNEDQIFWTLRNLGDALQASGRFQDAEPYQREALAIVRKRHPEGNDQTAWVLDSLARNLMATKRLPEAEQLYHEELAGWEKLKGVGSNEYAGVMRVLVQLYETTAQSEKAAEWKKKVAEFDQAKAEKKTAEPKP